MRLKKKLSKIKSKLGKKIKPKKKYKAKNVKAKKPSSSGKRLVPKRGGKKVPMTKKFKEGLKKLMIAFTKKNKNRKRKKVR